RNLPFREAMEKTRALTHRYYSCYPFLLQAAVLYLNHCMLAETQEERREVLQEAEALCRRIQQGCNEVRICSDALSLQAILKLQMGELREVIEMLEETADPLRISAQNDMLLIQAYQAAGETEKAKSAVQIWQYLYVMNLIGASNQALSLYAAEPERCEEIIRRTEGILKLYEIDRLHPNAAAQFYYQAALLYAAGAAEEMALKKLEQFAICVCKLLDSGEILLHGDAYFDRLDEWIERLPLGAQAPRHRAFAEQSALEALSRPEFDALRETERFQKICRHIVEGGHCHA
ncbi:MAG: XRE family transcriptional regulator, partial [Candidatus Limivivens sp.]|nr:XRE family transcriptional regulator [Candidatus Limivivens sp.]